MCTRNVQSIAVQFDTKKKEAIFQTIEFTVSERLGFCFVKENGDDDGNNNIKDDKTFIFQNSALSSSSSSSSSFKLNKVGI